MSYKYVRKISKVRCNGSHDGRTLPMPTSCRRPLDSTCARVAGPVLLRLSCVQGGPWLRWLRTSVNQEGIDGCSSRKADASTATAERTLPMSLGGSRASINKGVMVRKASLEAEPHECGP